ncbi:MAG: WG repeat-containing protein [Pedobacter sp.]|nr:MAG: WG repeat-containing protein [Pedobacter sp.]
MFKRLIKFFILLIVGIQSVQAEVNILENNKALLNKLAQFAYVGKLDSNFIKYKAESRYGYGIASRKTGTVIFAAEKNNSYSIASYGKYLAIGKRSSLGNELFGIIDEKGKVILDFKYDLIGNYLVPMPDSLVIVQVGNKFGVFNTKTALLSPIIYDNTNNVLNDYDASRNGTSIEAAKSIYSQLGLDGFYIKPVSVDYVEPNAKIIVNDNVAYLVNKKGDKISKNYDYDLESFYKAHPYEFYLGAVKDTGSKNPEARKLFLINGLGQEVAEISSHRNSGNRYLIDLIPKRSYYFINTKKIITIPDGYEKFVELYLPEGFIGFVNLKTKQKLFVDQYGNQLTIGEPPVPKEAILTQRLTDSEINDFKNLVTKQLYLGRVTKYQYTNTGKLFKETGFNYEGSDQPILGWEDTYYYDHNNKVKKITRYQGINEPFDLDPNEAAPAVKKVYNAKKQVVSTIGTVEETKYEERFTYDNFGNVKETTKWYDEKLISKSMFKYNAKRQVLVEEVFRDGKHDYTYTTSYDKQDRKIKYNMIDSRGISTSIWFYRYNSKGKLQYKIDLYGMPDEKKMKVMEAAPPLPPAPEKSKN